MNVKYKKYIDYIASDIELPYIKYLNMYELKQDEMRYVLSKVYNQPVSIEGRNVYNTDGNEIYYENSDGIWIKKEYDANGNEIYRENSNGYWYKREYDHNGNEIYYENNSGYWVKHEYDHNGIEIYHEDSHGYIIDKR